MSDNQEKTKPELDAATSAVTRADLLAEFSKEDLEEAIRETEYKYFGDYEMSEDQREAVKKLVLFASVSLGIKCDQLCYGGERLNKLYHSLG